jgi:Cytochrome c3
MQPLARLARIARIALTLLVGGLLWFALAFSAAAQDPSASPASIAPPSASPAPSASAGASADASASAGAPASPDASGSPASSPWPSLSFGPLFDTAPTPTPAPLAPGPAAPSPIVHPNGNGKNSCYDCHAAVNDKQAAIAAQYKSSAHAAAGVTCADCHGGDPGSDQITVAMDPKNGFIGVPDRSATVGICGSCHANPERMKGTGLATDQYAKYWTSVHGQRLLVQHDTQVAICTDCHGVHDIKKTSDASAKTFPLNVPELCSSCHSDKTKMAPYGIPTDQYDIYAKSVHGVALLQNKDTRAPNCASCHGSHDAKPPTSATVVQVCGTCHTATQTLYEQSLHSQLPSAAPQCWTCHGTHDVQQPSADIFFHPTTPNYTCATCHDLTTHKLRIQLGSFANIADRRCDTCHHPDSQIYSQIQGISNAVRGAETAYDHASAQLQQAAALGMITADAELSLAGAKTSLIQAEAAVHTTKLSLVAQLSADAKKKSEEAMAMATAKVDESFFRRQAMVIVLALILASVLFLALTKRHLDRELEGR